MSCKNCLDRHPNCWDTCETYLKDKEKREREKRNRKYDYISTNDAGWSYTNGNVGKWKRYKNSRSK